MAHARQQIRDALVVFLTGLTTTADRVYGARVYPLETTSNLVVRTNREEVVDNTMGVKQMRELSVTIEGTFKGNDPIDDDLDTIAAEVETKMASDTTLGGKVIDMDLESTEIDLSPESEKVTGAISLTYKVTYRVAETDPTTLIS